MTIPLGMRAPWFVAPTPTNPQYAFSSVAGRYIALGFLPMDPAVRRAVVADIAGSGDLLDDEFAAAFLVVRDPQGVAAAADRTGLRWFLDPDGAVSNLYGAVSDAGAERPHWLVLDPSLRVRLSAPIGETQALLRRLRTLPPPDLHAGVETPAPVLVAPRILEPNLCRTLIAYYEARGGCPSGVMREVDGRTVGVIDDFKSRRDAEIEDVGLQDAIRTRIKARLIPEIEMAFGFVATRIERYIVACYDAAEGGYFRPHRDNTTPGTAHRRFAVTINLNAEDYEGGDLRFPEFGRRLWRAPTGGAVVFSCALLHEATPVRRGRRYATLPFLYDEDGKAVRTRNERLVGAATENA